KKPKTSSCKNIINRINTDISQYGDSIQHQHLIWMNAAWLEHELGPSQTTTQTDYLYNWLEYSLFVAADGYIADFGTMPKGIHPQTYADAVAVLGEPRKTLSESLTLHTWE